MSESRRMLQNAGLMLLNRIGLILVGILFAALIPRMMGPEEYGRFSLLLSFSIWFYLFSELGISQTIARHLPRLGEGVSRTELLGALVALRLATGFLAGCAYVATAAVVLPDLPLSVVSGFALAVVIGGWVDPLFAWLLGQNRANLWGFSFLMRRVGYLVLIPFAYRYAGQVGAAYSVACSEAIVLILGLVWLRGDFDIKSVKLRLNLVTPLLKLSLLLFIGNIFAATFRFSGEALLRFLTHDYSQIAYFGVCMSVYTAAEASLYHLYMSATPFLSGLIGRDARAEAATWMERFLVLLTVATLVLLMAALLFATDVVPVLFGEAYTPSIPILKVAALILVVSVATGAANTAALLEARPGVYIAGMAIRVVVFWLAAPRLVRDWSATGVAFAMLGGFIASAIYTMWKMKAYLNVPLRAWGRAIATAVPFCAVGMIDTSLPARVGLFVLSVSLYCGLLWITRTLPLCEIRRAWSKRTINEESSC